MASSKRDMFGNLHKRSKKLFKPVPSSKQLVVVEPEDRLSFLPQELQSLVISLLPLHESIKTIILSKMWRKIWHSLPRLIFDYSQFPNMERKLDHFLEFIHQTLIHHDESNVKVFELCLHPLTECHTHIKNEWVTFAVQHNVHELVLYGKMEDLQQLPDCLFTCSSLIKLELTVVRLLLRWPVTTTLPNLRELNLKIVTLSEENFMLDLSSSCPALEKLTMKVCNLKIVKVLAISSYGLKYLAIAGCEGIEDCIIKLDTPSLQHFVYVDNVARDFSFMNMRSLSSACVIFREAHPIERRDACSQCVVKACQGLYNADCLTVNQFFMQFLARAHYLSGQLSAISFAKLERVRLYLWPIKQQIQTTFRLLSRCPKLRAINIDITAEGWTPDMLDQDLEPGNWAVPLTLKQLEFVRITNFEGKESEMELVRLLLANAPALNGMEIVLARDKTEPEKLSQSTIERNRVLVEILSFKNPSNVIISFR